LTPNAAALLGYLSQLADPAHAEQAGPLGSLRVIDPMRTALRSLEGELVAAARAAGHSWSEIGEALGESKATAFRKWQHVG
jgi:hypothetical protein